MALADPLELLQRPQIALFGGTFDPFHAGHAAWIDHLLAGLGLDGVLVVPAWRSPHRLEHRAAPGDDRVRLIQRGLGDRDDVAVWTFELERPEPSYSWLTVQAAAAQRSSSAAPVHWILGQDNLAGLPRWHRVEDWLAAVRPIVVRRDPERTLEQDLLRRGAFELDPPHPARASDLREALASGAFHLEHLAPAAEFWIRARGLYGANGAVAGGA
jgi:nicotinate (nicotinamide) nucleotide adenylyltransferase